MCRLVDINDFRRGLLDNNGLRFVVQVIAAINRGRIKDVGEPPVPVATPSPIVGGGIMEAVMNVACVAIIGAIGIRRIVRPAGDRYHDR